MKLFPSPRALSRAGVAASAAAFLALGLAAPAAADNGDVVRAQHAGIHQSGTTVTMDGYHIGTNLFTLDFEAGGELITYCIDIETGIRTGAWYNEDAWANYPGQGSFAEPGKALWILQNGYPALSGSELASAAGIDMRVSDEDALGATQAATPTDGGLAFTGDAVMALVAAALVAIVGGSGAVYLTRHRKARAGE